VLLSSSVLQLVVLADRSCAAKPAHPVGQVLARRSPVTMAQSPYESPQNARENLVVGITGFADARRELTAHRPVGYRAE
jgi:hypothetical protein